MKIKVVTTVEIEYPGPSSNPTHLAWSYQKSFGDSPRFFGDSLIKAMRGACLEAVSNAEVYRDLTDSVTGPAATETTEATNA